MANLQSFNEMAYQKTMDILSAEPWWIAGSADLRQYEIIKEIAEYRIEALLVLDNLTFKKFCMKKLNQYRQRLANDKIFNAILKAVDAAIYELR